MRLFLLHRQLVLLFPSPPPPKLVRLFQKVCLQRAALLQAGIELLLLR